MGKQTIAERLQELSAFAEFLEVDIKRTKFIKDSGSLDLERIAAGADSYLASVEERFSKLPDKVADSALQFTSGAYLRYLDSEFVGTQLKNGAVYSPDSIVNAARALTLEFENLGQVNSFYEMLEQGLEKSKRFVYKLITQDILSIHSKVNERKGYTREKFGDFALDVMKNAINLTRNGSTDKGTAFKNRFYELVNQYFPESNLTIGNTKGLDMDILENYAVLGKVGGIIQLQRDYGKAIHARWSSHPDGHNRRISLGFEISNGEESTTYKSGIDLEGVRVPPQVKQLLMGIGETTAANIRAGNGKYGAFLDDTIAYIKNVRNHL